MAAQAGPAESRQAHLYNAKAKEVAISFSDFSNYRLTYSFGNSNNLWRFSTIFGRHLKSTTSFATYDRINNQFDAGVSLGKEFRQELSDKLFIRYG